MQLSSIFPRRIRRWIRNRQTSRNLEQAYSQRRQVAERLITDFKLKQSDGDSVRHVLFIVIDALRGDHVSFNGYTRRTTPFLDNLAENAAVFRDAVCTAPWTYPSVASIHTSLYPHNHGGVYLEDPRGLHKGMMPQRVRDNILFLPEVLSHFGFATYLGSVFAPVEASLGGRFQRVSADHRRNASYILRNYIRWLGVNHQENRTFAHLHLGDVHGPLRVPEPYRSAFGKIPDIPLIDMFDYYAEDIVPGDSAFEYYRENRIKFYDAALLYVDAQLQACFHQLQEMRIMDKTLVVITADHGEELWDHMQIEKEYFFSPRAMYGVGHGHHLWQEVIGVPLLVLGPEITAQDVSQRVSLVDVMPSVLRRCGIQGWEAMDLDGQDLFAHTDGRVIFSEDIVFGYEKKAVFEGRYKLYYSKGDGISWVFDLEEDPHEESPLDLPEVADRLIQYIPETVRSKEGEERISVDEETKKQLRDLGYLD
jgi:arylsulfatase A-like enzyme